MLVQRRRDGLRLIAQHDHALLSGVLASAWADPVPFETVLGVGLHDQPWQGADAHPRFNAETGRPHDFLDYPTDERLAIYTAGLDGLAQLHPYVGALVSWHYSSFEQMRSNRDFVDAETARRAEIDRRLPWELADEVRQKRDLKLLQLLDVLSLYCCLAPPSAEGELPRWLEPESFAKTPVGKRFEVRWAGDDRLLLEPSPLARPAEMAIPYRDLPLKVGSQAELDAAVAGAELRWWRLRVE